MATKYVTQTKLKKNTIADIFGFILDKGKTARREIERETGFSWGTVSASVAFLIEKGYVVEEKTVSDGTAGRVTLLLKPASEGIVSIGLDVNRSGFSCKVIALDASVKKSIDAEFTAETRDELLRQSEALCRAALEWCRDEGLRVFSLGIAIQGSVNGRLGVSMKFPGITEWTPINIKEHFSCTFHLPVYLGHDPKCMLLGEMSLRRCNDCLLFRVDEGIGMAVSLDGRILDDTERFELGHTVAVWDDRGGRCQQQGSLEEYGSLSAIPAVRTKGADAVLSAPKAYAAELARAGEYFARALYNMYTLFKPQRIIITGKASRLECFTESSISILKGEDVEVTVDPDNSAAYGAAVESIKSAIKDFVF